MRIDRLGLGGAHGIPEPPRTGDPRADMMRERIIGDQGNHRVVGEQGDDALGEDLEELGQAPGGGLQEAMKGVMGEAVVWSDQLVDPANGALERRQQPAEYQQAPDPMRALLRERRGAILQQGIILGKKRQGIH